jgi:uncharacterized protein (UPF0332 family)
MSFDWPDYLSLAVELHSTHDASQELQEARLRSSISRAYYAVYNEARRLLQSHGVKLRGEFAHAQVLDELKSLGTKGDRISSMLRRLRDDRNKADYDRTIKSKLSDLTQGSLVKATTIRADLASLNREISR